MIVCLRTALQVLAVAATALLVLSPTGLAAQQKSAAAEQAADDRTEPATEPKSDESSQAEAPLPPDVAARVNGQPITRAELTRTLSRYYAARALDSIIQQMVIRQEARRLGIEATRKEIDRAVIDFYGSRNFRSGMPLSQRRKQWRRRLTARGLSVEDFRRDLELEVLLKKLADRRIKISDEQVRAEFDRRYGEQLRLSQIVVDSEDQARKIYQRIAAGQEFAVQARRWSKGRTAADGGKRLLLLARGQTEKAYETVAFSLKVAQVSRPFKTTQGWCILKLDERVAARPVKFEDVKDELREELRQAEQRRLSPVVLNELLQKARIERGPVAGETERTKADE